MITRQHSIWYSLNNYKLTFGKWRTGRSAEDGKQPSLIALKPAFRSEVPQKMVNLKFPHFELWNRVVEDNYSY